MSKTTDNLQAAFAGESQANRKYLAFAKQADKEGLSQVAKLFRAAAEAETIHAHNHLRVLGGIKTTKENLEEAINGETYEFTKMYPQMIIDAQDEDIAAAERSFNQANEVEKVHENLFSKASKDMLDGQNFDYYICEVCGLTAEGDAPDKCPVCGAPKNKFKLVS